MPRTPVNDVTMFDSMPADEAVALSFANPGNHRYWHLKRLIELQESMPVLYHNLLRLAKEKGLDIC